MKFQNGLYKIYDIGIKVLYNKCSNIFKQASHKISSSYTHNIFSSLFTPRFSFGSTRTTRDKLLTDINILLLETFVSTMAGGSFLGIVPEIKGRSSSTTKQPRSHTITVPHI